MDGYHPKRRKDKYNPYTIYKNECGDCFLSFKDGQGVQHHFQIDQNLFSVFDQFELEDLSYLNVVDRHIEQSEQTDASINERAVQKADTVEETVIRNLSNERLHKAISKLPETQRRRLVLYYFLDLTYKQIAEMEGCSHPAVIKSVKSALNALKKFFQG